MPTKKAESGEGLQGWRVWLLLTAVIQLTLWVRVKSLPHIEFDEEEKSKDATTFVVSSDVDVSMGDDDPCSGFKTCGSCTFSRFNYFLSSSTQQKSSCNWCSLSSTCYSTSKQTKDYCMDHHTNTSAAVSYEYDCPLGPIPYPDNPPTLLPNWMGEFYQAGLLNNVRLVDLSLPGTHDSLSYDLSLTVSEDGIDGLKELAKLLHTLSGGTIKILPGDLEEFFRMQAKTQQLTLTQQLDNGARFLDVRIMWEGNAWYSIHFMQSKRPAEEYLKEIRRWLDAHPQEVVVIWLSKHGSTTATGDSQYPGVSKEQKKQFWDKYCQIFDGLMQATNETSIFQTPLAHLVEKNHRLISYISDYMEFTQNSAFAENAAFIQNAFDDGDGVFKDEKLLQSHIDYFKNASVNNAALNKKHGFTLLAMNTASPSWQVIAAAKNQFLHWLKEKYYDSQREESFNATYNKRKIKHIRVRQQRAYQPQILDGVKGMLNASPLWQVVSDITRQLDTWMYELTRKKQKDAAKLVQEGLFSSCSSHIKIPGVNHWCPKNLMDISQLSSYYNQIAVEEAFQNCFADDGNKTRVLAAFPNAFYLDVLDYDGTLRVGPELLDGSQRGDASHMKTKDAKYALVDTILAYNARVACVRRTSDSDGCDNLLDRIHLRRSRNLLQRWSEPDLGRHDDWPPYSYDAPIRQGHPGMNMESIFWHN